MEQGERRDRRSIGNCIDVEKARQETLSVHQTKDGRWFCTYRLEGRQKFEYFGRGDLARYRARQRDEEILRERGKLHIAGGMFIAELLQAYHREHYVEASTRSSDYYRITAHLLPALGTIQAEALSTQRLHAYVNERIEEGVSRPAAAREVSILKAAYQWGRTQNPALVMTNPIQAFTVPKSKVAAKPTAPMTQGELEALLRVAPPWLSRALLLVWYCGMRPGGEVTRILWSDVLLETSEIRVESARKGGPAVRYVPIHEALAPLLDRWRQTDLVTIQETNGNLRDPSGMLTSIPVVHYLLKPVGSLKRSWATAKKRAGITRRLRLYDIRHAWFTNALRAGGDLKAVSEVGGHSRPDTTLRIYDHVTQDRHRQAVAKIPAIHLPNFG